MKIRTNHVSNSSTSSFIIVGNQDISKLPIRCVELTPRQIKRVEKDIADFTWNQTDKVYLTPLLSDAGDEYYIAKYCKVQFTVYEYSEGSWGYPYGEDRFEVVANTGDFGKIWLRKENNEDS